MTASESTLDDYPRRYCPICHNVVRSEFRPGPGGRPNASCPKCRSLDRHRFFAILLSMLEPVIDDLGRAARRRPVAGDLAVAGGRSGARLHLKFDLGADNRLVDVLGSLTEIPLRDGCVDLMVCYHVLEHIPDDRAAMREMARVLAPGGMALRAGAVPPWHGHRRGPRRSGGGAGRAGSARPTTCATTATTSRTAWSSAGLAFQRVTPRSLLGEDMCDWLRLGPHQMVWIVRSSAGAPRCRRRSTSRRPASPARSTRCWARWCELRGELVTQRRAARQLGKDVARLRAENAALREAGGPAATVRKIARRAVRRR